MKTLKVPMHMLQLQLVHNIGKIWQNQSLNQIGISAVNIQHQNIVELSTVHIYQDLMPHNG